MFTLFLQRIQQNDRWSELQPSNLPHTLFEECWDVTTSMWILCLNESTSFTQDIPQSQIADQIKLIHNNGKTVWLIVLFQIPMFFMWSIQIGEVVIYAPDSSLIPVSLSQSWQLYRPICHHKKSFSAARGTPLFFFNNLGLHETSFMFRKPLRRAGRDSRQSMQQHNAIVSSLCILAPTETQTSKAGGVKPWNYR